MYFLELNYQNYQITKLLIKQLRGLDIDFDKVTCHNRDQNKTKDF